MMDLFKLTNSELEDILDQAKTIILLNLVHNKLLDMDTAEEYAIKNTIVLRKKSFFRTITNKWKKSSERDSYFMVMVGNNHIDSTVEDPSLGGKGVLPSNDE